MSGIGKNSFWSEWRHHLWEFLCLSCWDWRNGWGGIEACVSTYFSIFTSDGTSSYIYRWRTCWRGIGYIVSIFDGIHVIVVETWRRLWLEGWMFITKCLGDVNPVEGSVDLFANWLIPGDFVWTPSSHSKGHEASYSSLYSLNHPYTTWLTL